VNLKSALIIGMLALLPFAGLVGTTPVAAAADKVLYTNPPGARIPSVRGGWFVQSLSLESSGGKRGVHVSFGVLRRACAGHGANDGPWLDIALKNAQGQTLREISHVAALMVPDAATVSSAKYDVTDKVSEAVVDSAALVSAVMRADGKC